MTTPTPNDSHLINASIEVEKHVSRAIPRRDALRRIILAIIAFSNRYPDLATLDLDKVALLLTMLVIMVGTYVVDFAMLSPISEFAGRSARIGTALLARLIPITLPLLLLVIESWIANGRHEAKKQQEGAMFADTSAVRKWTIGGILFSLFVPLMNIALTRAIIAHLRAAGANDAKLSGLQLGLWVLAVFSLTGHLLIAFSGDVPKRLKSFFLYGFGASFLGTIKAIRKWRYEPLRRIARIKVLQYLHLRDQYMKAHGVFIPIGPFAKDVIEWIREEFADLTDIDDHGKTNTEQ